MQFPSQTSLLDIPRIVCSNGSQLRLMKLVPKTELSPDNGCIIDTKWKVGPLSYHACASAIGQEHPVHNAPMPEIVVFDHIGFKGAAARTTLSFHFLGDFWNDRI